LGWRWCHSLSFAPSNYPTSGIRAEGVSKVFLTEVSGKRVQFKCVNGGTSDGTSEEYINVEEGLEGEIVRYSSMYLSMSLCSTLGMNEKVEQHITKKTHKPNALKFWDSLICLALFSLLWNLSVLSPRIT